MSTSEPAKLGSRSAGAAAVMPLEEWLPDDHLARFVVEIVEQLDLSALERYLAESACRHGLYLVGWFLCDAWDTGDYRRGDTPKWTLAEATAYFEDIGKVRTPFPGTDFSSFLLQAQSSKAQILGLANAGGDTTNSIKQAAEFGITKGGQSLAGLLVFLPDVHGLGLNTAQGLIFTETFYWDLNDQTRAFNKRFAGLFPLRISACNCSRSSAPSRTRITSLSPANTGAGMSCCSTAR